MDADVLPSVATSTTTPPVNGGRVPVGNVGVSNLPKGVLSEAPTPDDIALAKEAAAAGDQGAIDWLKALGITTGVVATGVAGYGIARALANRKGKVSPVAAPVPIGSAKGSTSIVPHVNKVYGEHLVSPETVLPSLRNVTPAKELPSMMKLLPRVVR